MVIEFDAVSSTSGIDGTVETVAHTASGSNRFLFVGVGLSAAAPGSVTGVTYNGDALAKIWDHTTGVNHRCEGWYMVDPDLGGPFNIEVTFTGEADEWCIGGVSLTGVHQTATLGTPAENAGESATPTVDVTSAVDEWVIDMIYCAATSIAAHASQTMRWEQENISGNSGGCSTEEAAGSPVTMSWTMASNDWVIGGVSIKPAADAPVGDGQPPAQTGGPSISKGRPRMMPSGSSF